MVKCQEEVLDGIFGALADANRRSVVLRLVEGEKTVGELAEPLGMTMAGVMKHLTILEGCGLVNSEKRGRSRYCRLEPVQLKVVNGWIEHVEQFWDLRLRQLNDVLEEMD
jgi:DNA-binding transcriptional ArsR family regulator